MTEYVYKLVHHDDRFAIIRQPKSLAVKKKPSLFARILSVVVDPQIEYMVPGYIGCNWYMTESFAEWMPMNEARRWLLTLEKDQKQALGKSRALRSR